MKSIVKTLLAASLSIAAVSACSEEKLAPSTAGTKTTVHFGAVSSIVDNATKATLTPNDAENAFEGRWENGDELSVNYFNGQDDEDTVNAQWTGSNFSAVLPEYTGEWMYEAAYPVPDASDSHVDFGSNRTQKGNAYNSKYDIMIGSAFAENAAAGKDDEGNNIVFNMERQTAIAYFHFTSNLDEAIKSATLSVAGDNAYIASNYAYVSGFKWAAHGDCTSITVTFPEEAPSAKDFQLWFNVLPTEYTSMSLTIETATKTLTINKSTSGSYEAGHLYKVNKKSIPEDKWVDKQISNDFTLVTEEEADWTGSYLLVGVNDGKYYAYDESVSTDSSWGKCSEVMTDNDAISSSFSPIALEIIKGTSEGAYFIMTPSGKYLSASASKKFNLISEYSSDVCDFNILFDSGNVTIKLASSDQRQIRYNYNGGSGGFRWYDGISVDPISLYKGPSVDKYMISFDSVDGGSFSSSVIKAVVGTEITLTATPDTGYEFNNDWSVKDASGSDITVADGKFTMPASNVTVAGSFTQLSYTITKTDAVGGSFVVMSGETEVSSAHYNDVITLKATPDEGYEFTSWTVTYKDGEADKSFNPNGTFNMLASDVSVSAKFTEIAKIPVYASLTELIAAGAPTKDGTQVTVTLTDEVITKFYKNGNYTNGVYFNVGNQEIMVYCRDTPSDWKVGGAVSGTLTNCKWKIYNGTWELCPDDYTELTYVAPLEPCEAPSIVLDGATATITCATDGATIYYTVGESPADPTADDAEYTSPVTLTDGQTIKAIAIKDGMLNSSVSSKKYVEGGASIVKIVSTFTDNNLNTSEKAMTWKSSISANSFESSDPSRGVQFGAAKGKFTITGTGHDSKVKKISIIISTNGTGNTISATVGGVAIGKEISLTKANNYEVVFESSSEMSGDIVFNVNDSIKSVYFKSITINPED